MVVIQIYDQKGKLAVKIQSIFQKRTNTSASARLPLLPRDCIAWLNEGYSPCRCGLCLRERSFGQCHYYLV